MRINMAMQILKRLEPRRIEIGSSSTGKSKPKLIEGSKKASAA